MKEFGGELSSGTSRKRKWKTFKSWSRQTEVVELAIEPL